MKKINVIVVARSSVKAMAKAGALDDILNAAVSGTSTSSSTSSSTGTTTEESSNAAAAGIVVETAERSSVASTAKSGC